MNEYSAGTDIIINVPHSNNGTALTLTDMQFEVLDAEGEELIAFATVSGFNPAENSTDIEIDGIFNLTDEKIDVRQVNLKLVTSSGTYKQSIFYKIIGDLTKLTVMTDSFMTFAESVIVRAKMSESLKYFDALSDDIKAVSLENSYERIIKHKFKISPTACEGTDLATFTPEQFKSLPLALRDALKKGQLAQANALVENSPVRDKIRDGIISETIGESSMFFKQTDTSGNSKYPGIADDSYIYLKDWLYKSATSAQIWRIGRA